MKCFGNFEFVWFGSASLWVSRCIVDGGGEGGETMGTKFRPMLDVLTDFVPAAVLAKNSMFNDYVRRELYSTNSVARQHRSVKPSRQMDR